MTTRSHDGKVTWLTGSQHSTSRQHLEETTWPQLSLEDTSLRTLEEYLCLSLCVKVYPCMSAKKADSSAFLWHLLLIYPCSVYEIIPTPIRQILNLCIFLQIVSKQIIMLFQVLVLSFLLRRVLKNITRPEFDSKTTSHSLSTLALIPAELTPQEQAYSN